MKNNLLINAVSKQEKQDTTIKVTSENLPAYHLCIQNVSVGQQFMLLSLNDKCWSLISWPLRSLDRVFSHCFMDYNCI